jgi:hypothetical protein
MNVSGHKLDQSYSDRLLAITEYPCLCYVFAYEETRPATFTCGGGGDYPCRVRHVTRLNKSRQCFLQNNKHRAALSGGCVGTGTREFPTDKRDIGHKPSADKMRQANWAVALSQNRRLSDFDLNLMLIDIFT